MVEVEHAPLRRIQLNTVRGVVKFLHRALNFGFDLRVLRLVIKRPVFKDDVFPFGHVHELERRGDVPAPLQLMDVPEGEYIVFEHGPFDYETENAQVEAEIERAMKEFDYAAHGVQLDTAQGRVFYFYHDCTRFWKYVRPVKRVEDILGQ